MKPVGLVLVGLGNVGRRFLRLLIERDDTLREKYGLVFSVHCVVDSSGVAVSDDGFDLPGLLEHKVCGLKLCELREFDEGLTLAVALDSVQCEILLEASPVDLNTGNPGLSNCRTALEHGLHLVLANKAPLALAQAELDRLAADTDVGILYSATFCGGLPVLNIVRRDMVYGKILGFRGIFNSRRISFWKKCSRGAAMQTRSVKLKNEGLRKLIRASTSAGGTLPPSSSSPRTASRTR